MKFPPAADTARLSEIFSSIQGEGTHLGERHIFVRFEECHIHCKYCDELGKPGVETGLEEAVKTITGLEKTEGPHAYVSFTGGEPLLYLRFLRPLMERVKALGLGTYLETDGILAPALKQVIDLCDCIAMDMKPASVTGERNFDREHEEFLKIAVQKETFVKIVLSPEIIEREFDAQVAILARVAPDVPLILQPLSSETGEGHEDPQLMAIIERLQRRASARLRTARIVPRFHKILKIR